MSYSVDSLRAVLEAQTPGAATGYVVAVSGGADSTALLAAMAAHRHLPLRAVHVDHGLQAAAAEFRDACGALCRRLDVPLTILPVVVSTPDGVSVEAAAREARYAALAGNLREGECLLTAHHREDQAETLLLQALRGAGLRGMSAMPPCRPFGRGWHLRPVLDVAQRELHALGAAAAVDPMNEDLRFDRVYLRRRVWPLIDSRWPGAVSALSRTARHAAEAQRLLERTAEADLGRLRDGEALSLPRLRALGPAERINAVRHWLGLWGAEPPPTARLHEALRQFFEADEDHLPAMVWGDCALRRYRDRVFVTAAHPPRLQGTRNWMVALGASVDLGPGLGALCWAAAPQRGMGIAAHRLPAFLSVRARRGGETLRPAAHAKTQSLQHLCQSFGVLPWLRDALPLVYADEVLIAVGDLWQDSSACSGGPPAAPATAEPASAEGATAEPASAEGATAEPASAEVEWVIVWERAPIIV